MSDTGHESTLHPVAAEPHAAEQKLQRLRAVLRQLQLRIGEQFAAAVNDGRLDIEVANSMLESFGMPMLPRRWRVHLSLPMVCEVTAATADDAFDVAAEVIENAVRATDAGAAIDITFDTREEHRATPGEVDAEAVIDDWADHHLST